MGTVYIRHGLRGALHVSVTGSGRTLCGIRTDLEPGQVTVHDRVTCQTCTGIVMLVRDGTVSLLDPSVSGA